MTPTALLQHEGSSLELVAQDDARATRCATAADNGGSERLTACMLNAASP
jgi:hypothetical protein